AVQRGDRLRIDAGAGCERGPVRRPPRVPAAAAAAVAGAASRAERAAHAPLQLPPPAARPGVRGLMQQVISMARLDLTRFGSNRAVSVIGSSLVILYAAQQKRRSKRR